MITRSVVNRIAIDLSSLDLPIPPDQALEILKKRNIRPVEVDIQALAKSLVGKAQWKLPSRQWEAPHFFDCSSLTKWLYGQKGVWLPRRHVQQFEYCRQNGSIHGLGEIIGGDLIFLSSLYNNGVKMDSDEGIGHVCLAVGNDSAICATNSELGTGVLELSIDILLRTRKLRSVGRLFSSAGSFTTLMLPPGSEVETIDDVRWKILQSL